MEFNMRFIMGFILYLCVVQLSYGIENKQPQNKTWVYVVSNGDNLWNITSKFLKKIDYYTELQKLNNIKYPKRINPGTVLRIPMKWLKHSPATASISFQQGNNYYFRNQKLHPLTLATKLVLGDEIRIGDNASATVVFADKSEMVLFKNTIISFDHLSSYGKTGMVDTRIRVIQGKVETNAQKNKGPGSRLDISTPSAISSVRGTQYRVSNSSENVSTVEVIEGEVAVAGDKPNNIISVTAGLGTRIEKGQAPSKPVELLPAPKITTKNQLFEIPPIITWQAISNARRYNITLSDNKQFKSILWQTLTDDTKIELPNKLADGKYWYRISAIDSLGIEGIPVDTPFTLNLFPYAPVLNNTTERFNNNSSNKSLSWTADNKTNADSYLIEVAKDKSFTQEVLKKSLKSAQFTLPDSLPFGEYYWRVSAIINNDQGPASSIYQFNWATKLNQPSCFVDEASSTNDITWTVLEQNHNITIQLAQDSQFNNIINEYSFDDKTTHLNVPADQELFLRCRVVIPNSKITSQWSEKQHITQIDKSIISLFGFMLLIILI